MKKILYCLLLSSSASLAVAQNVPQSEAFWGGVLPVAALNQQASLMASQVMPATNEQLMLVQQGVNNRLSFVGTGAGNQAQFTQRGANNDVTLTITGQRNTYALEQLGNNNALQLTDMRGDDVRLQVRQNGNNNSLNATGVPFGAASTPIRIEQSGGARAIITTTYQ